MPRSVSSPAIAGLEFLTGFTTAWRRGHNAYLRQAGIAVERPNLSFNNTYENPNLVFPE